MKMTKIKGFEQKIREDGREPKGSFVHYLAYVIQTDETEEGEPLICIRLDEEGNDWMELNIVEAKTMGKFLLKIAEETETEYVEVV